MRCLVLAVMALSWAGAACPETALPPYAWLEHCARSATAACQIGRPLTPRDAMYINMTVNAEIKGVVDRGQETWRAFPESRRGDCDEYVMTKRAALIALGKPAAELSVVAGRLADGSKHIVLEAMFGERTYVLDNLTDDLYAPHARPYEWDELQRQKPGSVTWIATGQ